MTPVTAQDTPAGYRSHSTPADYGSTTRVRTATSHSLPRYLLSWYEHSATARQHAATAHATPLTPTPATVSDLVPEPIADTTSVPGTVLLKALLCQRHWQTYRTFCREYDKAAKTIDGSLVGRWPSRAQLHRWFSGTVKGLPYPDHCRVLEAMFPDYTAAQLMAVIW